MRRKQNRYIGINYSFRRVLSLPVGIVLCSFLIVALNSCGEDSLADIPNTVSFSKKLSDYNIFEGAPANLKPLEAYQVYSLSTELFSDYALKQRLFRIPKGKQLLTQGDGLLEFPDSTVLVKTFFYQNDLRDPSKGRRIVETRLLVNLGGRWNVATYVWNESQTDALLVMSGLNSTINWINERGEPKVISYHVPSARECVTCHSNGDAIMPIGPKTRNLHHEVNVDGVATDQLSHWENLRLLNRTSLAGDTLAAWDDESGNLEDRVRAYVDVNCGHCHQPRGIAGQTKLFLDFEHTADGTLERRKDAILQQMRRGRMPQIGTTLVHEEGVNLIEAYIKSLK